MKSRDRTTYWPLSLGWSCNKFALYSCLYLDFFLKLNPSTTTVSSSRSGDIQPVKHIQALSFSLDMMHKGLFDTRAETNICPSIPGSNYLSGHIPSSNCWDELVHQTGFCARKVFCLPFLTYAALQGNLEVGKMVPPQHIALCTGRNKKEERQVGTLCHSEDSFNLLFEWCGIKKIAIWLHPGVKSLFFYARTLDKFFSLELQCIFRTVSAYKLY